jgi:uncharacterized protein
MGKEEIKAKIKKAIEQDPDKNAIKKASLFGSFLHGDFKPNSDVDLLVELNGDIPVGLFKYVAIQDRLGESIGKQVDLVTTEALSKYFRDRVLAEAEIIYEG